MTRWFIAASVAFIAVATLLPGPAGPTATHLCLICGPLGGVDAVLNVLLFVPLGVGLALARVRPVRAVLGMVAFSLIIELSQWNLVSGRDASIGDILTNSLGGCLGYAIGHFRAVLIAPRTKAARRLLTGWLGIWLTLQLFVAYSFTPALPDPPYYGQLDRPRGHTRLEFPGEVLSSSVAAQAVRPGQLPNAAHIREALGADDGAPFHVVAAPGGLVPGRAELAVLSGPGMISVASLEQDEDGLIFGLRTAAERLRLRPYEYRLPEVFPAESGSARKDTISASGQFGTTRVTVTATTNGRRRVRTFVPRVSQGWILFMPVPTYIDDNGIELLVSAFFLVLLMAPSGYWMFFTGSRHWTSRDSAATAAMHLIVMAGGLVIAPLAFGLRPAAVWEWAFAFAGAIIGFLLARLPRGAPPAASEIGGGV